MSDQKTISPKKDDEDIDKLSDLLVFSCLAGNFRLRPLLVGLQKYEAVHVCKKPSACNSGTLSALKSLEKRGKRKEKKLAVKLDGTPRSFSWTLSFPGVFGPIRSQKSDTCLPEASIACLEAAKALNTGVFVKFSVQEIVDKCPEYKKIYAIFPWIISNGVSLRKDYPDKEGNHFTPPQIRNDWQILHVDKFIRINGDNVEEIKKRVMIQPVIGILINTRILEKLAPHEIYRPAIGDVKPEDHLHAVLITAFEEETWEIRNSWDVIWCNKGLGHISKGNNLMFWEERALVSVYYPVLEGQGDLKKYRDRFKPSVETPSKAEILGVPVIPEAEKNLSQFGAEKLMFQPGANASSCINDDHSLTPSSNC